MKKYYAVIILTLLTSLLCSCKEVKSITTTTIVDSTQDTVLGKIVFIELGSVNCIPCKAMQPVMKKIEEKYKDSVQVIFYDVWTEKDKPMAEKYQIQVIPTQVFLDKDGKEFFRHQGFFPYEEIEKILNQKGAK